MNNKNNRVHCDKCGTKVSSPKKLKRVNEGFLCIKCRRENRANHREFLRRDILGIRKREDIVTEWAEKRKEREKEQERLRKIYGDAKPQIKSIRRDTPKISSLGIYITKNEKLVLYKKLVHDGLSSEEANERIKLLSEEMVKVREELKNEVKTQEEFNKRFKEEFAKASGRLK